MLLDVTCTFIVSCYLAIYLQVFHFSFPFATIIHERAVDNKGLYFTTHEVIRKNLKRNGQESYQEDDSHTFNMDSFLKFSGQREVGGVVKLETQRHVKFLIRIPKA